LRKKLTFLNLLLVAVLALGFSGSSSRAQSSGGSFADPAFANLWGRTDSLVANGTVQRSFYWGPTPGVIKQETYTDSPTGTRLVQYFDKSRMEINNPNGDRTSQFFVTNGLLTVELITGRLQTGSTTFEQRAPAEIDLASDVDDPNAPTYASFQKLMGKADSAVSSTVMLFISRDGKVAPSPTARALPPVTIAYYEPTTGHNIAKPIWDFLNASGPVSVTTPSGVSVVTQTLNNPWFYATGYPIAEPYWADVKIAGNPTLVLIQPFERRVVTYVPSMAPAYQVQMGNIGQHYYDWRYNNLGAPTTSPTPGGAVPTATPGSGLPPVGGTALPMTLIIGKPVISHGDTQTLTVQTAPTAHVQLICTDSHGGRFNNPCYRDAHGSADPSGSYVFSWMIDASTPTGVMTVTAIANLGNTAHGATSGTFMIQ
jgi:hypothetical protein